MAAVTEKQAQASDATDLSSMAASAACPYNIMISMHIWAAYIPA